MAEYIHLLRRSPGFAKLWAAQVISFLGDWFGTIVLSALVVKFTEGSGQEGLAVGAFLIARLIPPLLVSPLSGVLVDRFDRRWLLIASDTFRAVVVLGFLLAASNPDLLWLIYVLTVIQFILSSVFEPGRNAIMPALLDESDLVVANTLGSVTWSVMLAVGAILGGVVAAIFGTEVALLVDAVSFLISALLIFTIHIDDRALAAGEEMDVAHNHDNRGFIDGLRWFFAHPATAFAILVKAGLSIGSVDAILIIYGTKLFLRGEDGTVSMALMWFAFGIGSIIGPLLLNRFSDGSVRSLRRLTIIGFVWVTLGWFVLGGSPTLEWAFVAILVRAMGGSVNWTYSSVIIQKSVPDAYLGRMFSLDFAGFWLLQGISVLITSLLIDSFGSDSVRQVVFITGASSVIPLILWIMATLKLERSEAVVSVQAASD